MVRVICFKGVEVMSNVSLKEEKRNVARVKKMLFSRLVEGEREKVMMVLVKCFGKLRFEDIEEVYNDGCLVLWNKMERDELELGKDSLVRYLMRVCKNIGNHYLRKIDDLVISLDEELVKRNEEDDEEGLMNMFDVLEEGNVNDDEKYKKLDRVWGRLSEIDKMILESYYLEGCKMDEIARKIGYKSADSVKSKKSKILKKMIEMMKNDEGGDELPSLFFG